MVPAGGADAQRADRAETSGVAAGVSVGAAEAAALFDFSHGGSLGRARPPDGSASGDDGGALADVVTGLARVASAGVVRRSIFFLPSWDSRAGVCSWPPFFTASRSLRHRRASSHSFRIPNRACSVVGRPAKPAWSPAPSLPTD